jgi:hypothetical protein
MASDETLERTITEEEGLQLVKKAWARGESQNFTKSILTLITDPIQPVNDAGRRRLHPILVSALISGVILFALFIYFTYFNGK